MCLAHRSKAEMRHTCRGTINLATANITVEDSCNFIISNGGAQTYHLKASSEVERQRWVTALELAKAKAVKMLAESGKRQVKSSRNRAGCGGGAGILKGLLWRKQVREVMWKTGQWVALNLHELWLLPMESNWDGSNPFHPTPLFLISHFSCDFKDG